MIIIIYALHFIVLQIIYVFASMLEPDNPKGK